MQKENQINEEIFLEFVMNAEILPITFKFTKENWKKEFGNDLLVKAPLGLVKVGNNQFEKTKSLKRDNFWYLLKPTLERPSFVFKEENAKNYIKIFKDIKKPRCFMAVSVFIQNAGQIIISSYRVDNSRAMKKIKENPVIYVAPENQGAMQRLHDWMTNGSK